MTISLHYNHYQHCPSKYIESAWQQHLMFHESPMVNPAKDYSHYFLRNLFFLLFIGKYFCLQEQLMATVLLKDEVLQCSFIAAIDLLALTPFIPHNDLHN